MKESLPSNLARRGDSIRKFTDWWWGCHSISLVHYDEKFCIMRSVFPVSVTVG